MKKRAKRVLERHCRYSAAQEDIDYLLVRSSARRTMSIGIDEKGNVKVSVPYYCQEASIKTFLKEKEGWIVKGVETARKNQKHVDQKRFRHGNRFLYLGRMYPLEVLEGDVKRARVDFDQNKWVVTIPPGLNEKQTEETVKLKMLKWYRAQAEETLGGRIFHYSRIIGEEPAKIAIRTQKRMWGCCDYNTRVIHLNWQIIMSPLCVVDYVVVHELCHLIIPNHSRRFWSKVRKFMPDFDIHRKWLKNNHLEMALPL
ncbi:MAG: M48 family metallopeptidase [Candidatus Omnitrophica bacterium]|nr:M48 family metallopeptidase [Candidatus Omnitrophota bacterium]